MSESLQNWSEFGLAGLTIASLFAALGLIVKWLVAHVDKQAARHADERKEWQASQRENADKITSQLQIDSNKIEKAMTQLSNDIRSLFK